MIRYNCYVMQSRLFTQVNKLFTMDCYKWECTKIRTYFDEKRVQTLRTRFIPLSL